MKSRINKLEYRVMFNSNKDILYYKDGVFHRDKDLPAMLWKDSNRVWFKNGLEHRDNNKPSSIFSDGRMYWFENGECIKDNLNEI